MNRMMTAVVFVLGMSAAALAAGTLTPKNSPDAPLQTKDHHVRVVINNGFAQTEVFQTFYNPGDQDLEAIYAFPIPKSASLSEMTIFVGEKEIHGEVLPKDDARLVYEKERDKGNDAGLAEKDGYQTFKFRVSPVRARSETKIRFVYYQPLEIDTNVGRYVYPMEEGGTDEQAKSFWLPNTRVEGTFSVDVDLKSAWPVAEVRIPGFEAEAKVVKVDGGHYQASLQRAGGNLVRDVVFYYRLEENLPGRIELIPYRKDAGGPGTFMMVVTPGLDLKPLTHGADYTFVLDVSGSMEGKIATLARGVRQALGKMKREDRFRIITFNESARDLTGGFTAASEKNLETVLRSVDGLRAGGSTNLYAGLSLALEGLDDDRVTSVVLVTDGVTNTGEISPAAFHKLMKQVDVRVFGFLMGNNANWPLMQIVCQASGGFWSGVSNEDDIVGQILMAKSKITYECLHDASLRISGVPVHDASDEMLGKVYRGQQLVFFGRYDKGGTAEVCLKARLSGEDRTYTTTFDFPETDTANPEIERLWALNRIESLELKRDIGLLKETEADSAIRTLGVDYQLVTDETSMVVLSDAAFEEHGIARKNRDRVALEHQAQAVRASQPAQNKRVDSSSKPAFGHSAPAFGGGAFDPVTGGLAVGLALMALAARRRNSGK